MSVQNRPEVAPRIVATAWSDIIAPPIPGRSVKPRLEGITMVMDKGRGIEETRDALNLCSEYIDYIKLGFGTSALYPEHILRQKIELIRNAHCEVYPGGTFLEIAYLQGRTAEFLDRAATLGFTAIEVSDGTVELPPDARESLIKRARARGFKVLSEVGKKDPRLKSPGKAMARAVLSDIESGAAWVIIEGRESGRGVGVYDREGHIENDRFEELLRLSDAGSRIIWEAPLKEQQEFLIRQFGPNVNMGNIPPVDVIAVESMRQGFRNDTLKNVML